MRRTESNPSAIEHTLHKWNKGRERFIRSKTLRGMIRHGRLDRLERFTPSTVDGRVIQAISPEGQDIGRLGRIAGLIWNGLMLTHVEDDHGVKVDPAMRRSHPDIHEELHKS